MTQAIQIYLDSKEQDEKAASVSIIMSTTFQSFHSNHLSFIVDHFFRPIRTLLGPCKALKFIVENFDNNNENDDNHNNNNNIDDVILTSSSLVFIQSRVAGHASCRLLMDACMDMEEHIGCGYTYMMTFSGNLLIMLYKLKEKKILLFEMNDILSLIRQDCKKIIEALKIPVNNKSTPLENSTDNTKFNKTCKILIENMSNRDDYSSGHDINTVKKLVSHTLQLLLYNNNNGKEIIITRNKLRKRIQITTLGGKYVEKSFTSYGVMIVMSPSECFHWMKEYQTYFQNGKVYRAGILKGDSILYINTLLDDENSNKTFEVEIDKKTSYDEIVKEWKNTSNAKYEKIIQHLKKLNIHILFISGNNNIDKKFLSVCKQNEIIILIGISSIDVQKIALLTDGLVSSSIMQLSDENIGSKPIGVTCIDTGWMDSEDAIYTSAKMNSKSSNSREKVSYLHFQVACENIVNTKSENSNNNNNNDNDSKYDDTIPISIVLYHSVYAMCKDMETLFWNMLFRNYNTLVSKYVLPGKGYTEVCFYHFLSTKSKLYQKIYQEQRQKHEKYNLKYSDDKSLLTKSLIYNEIATIFESQYLKVLENTGETFESSLSNFNQKYEIVQKRLLIATVSSSSSSSCNSNVDVDELGLQVMHQDGWKDQSRCNGNTDQCGIYDCYISKLDGIEKSFETSLLIMGCDTIIINS